MAVPRALAVLTLLLLASASAGAEPSTAEEILACMRGNVPDASMEQTVEFTSRDRTGYERVSRAEIRSKPPSALGAIPCPTAFSTSGCTISPGTATSSAAGSRCHST